MRSALPCTENNPELWFSDRAAEVAQAKALCFECPQRVACLTASANEEFGVWGGFDADERREGRTSHRDAEKARERARLAQTCYERTAAGETMRAIAASLGIAVSSVHRMRDLHRATLGAGEAAA
jgi:WhiB family redox-sensing transcriptional regulator